jgi:hypothetical protein
MSKASAFLDSVSIKTSESSLQALARAMKEAGDSRLSDEIAAVPEGKDLGEHLLILAYGLKLNGDDRLWKELDLEKRIKESVDFQAKVEALDAKPAPTSNSKAGRFLQGL